MSDKLGAFEFAQNALQHPHGRRIEGADPIEKAQKSLMEPENQPMTQFPEFLVDNVLSSVAQNILEAQAAYDKADQAYQQHAAILSARALTNPFPGKGKPPSNDKEREIAISLALTNSSLLIPEYEERSRVYRELRYHENQQENARIIAQMYTSDTRK